MRTAVGRAGGEYGEGVTPENFRKRACKIMLSGALCHVKYVIKVVTDWEIVSVGTFSRPGGYVRDYGTDISLPGVSGKNWNGLSSGSIISPMLHWTNYQRHTALSTTQRLSPTRPLIISRAILKT